LARYVEKFDKVKLKTFLVSEEEFQEALKHIGEDLKKAIQAAKYNIAQFHLAQKLPLKKIQTTDGVLCWQKSVAISKVGLYIPSRHAPLFSSILMMGIPANIAGCDEIILCSAPNSEGKLHPIILYTAYLLNIKKVYKLGGAQAIAAMAYGTESVPKVYKIFGPSNQYVTAAKQLVGKSDVAIDLPAGPSEMMVYANESANPTFLAADLLAIAEQDDNAQLIIMANEEKVADRIIQELNIQLAISTKKEFAERSLQNLKIIIFDEEEKCIQFANEFAPENLVLAVENDEVLCEKIINAGSVYLGHFSNETAGNYASGINNILPTNGNAKAYSAISVDSFVKKINFQKITEKGIKNLGEKLELMAEAEELPGRKNAISIRLKALEAEKVKNA
jgi:histidinol dehydrogenase